MAESDKYENVLSMGYRLQGGKHEYVIEDILGRGGFGITYKVKARVHVENIVIDAHFAVKEYFPDICWRDESDNATLVAPKTKTKEVLDGLKDFINEGRKLQGVCNLNHNIVSVNEVFEANSTAYYVLEYLEGGDLKQRMIDNGRPLTEQQMLEVMIPIGNAVQCLHDNNILHLDIKPSNIVMRKNHEGGEDEPVLIDFGIAVHFNSSGTPTTKVPSLGISAGYSPIEQYSELKVFDPRLDVYAFAATCYYLLTGKKPIEALNLPPGFVQNTIPTDVSPHVTRALAHAMSKEKDYRTPSIKELLIELTSANAPSVVGNQSNAMPAINYVPSDAQENTQRSLDNNVVGNVPPSPEQPKRKNKGTIIAIIATFLVLSAFAIGISFIVKDCSGREKSVPKMDTSKNVEMDHDIIIDGKDKITGNPVEDAANEFKEVVDFLKYVAEHKLSGESDIKSYQKILDSIQNSYENYYMTKSVSLSDKFHYELNNLKKTGEYIEVMRKIKMQEDSILKEKEPLALPPSYGTLDGRN